MLLPLLAGAASAADASPTPGAGAAPERFVLGVLATRPVALVQQEHQPLANYLAQQLNAEVQLRVLDYAALDLALELGQIDFLFTSPGHYLIVRRTFPLAGLLATLIRQQNGRQTTLAACRTLEFKKLIDFEFAMTSTTKRARWSWVSQSSTDGGSR
ncbi:MAG: hypothetical protein JM57_10395 [Comamonadaceae bacterium BICA1-1]|nr:MAG: hypothetical protein JM57_10395 [Comamonadaceae bacterium BICA1-1]